MPVALLAGGMATRLRPLTETIPKSLIEIAGRPFIFHQLELLKRQNINRVVLCVGHLGAQIEAVVGDGKEFGLSVSYSYERDGLLGTGGAIKKALPMLGDRFFVLYGDSYLPCSFCDASDAFIAAGLPALMTVVHNADKWGKSNVLMRGGKLVEYDKGAPRPGMEHIDYGLGVFSAGAFGKDDSRTAFDLADLYRELSLGGRLAAHEVTARFYEVGSREGIRETEEFIESMRRGR